jgi:F-type H+-transporting ATPase subunit b
MQIDWVTVAAQIVNFIILIWLLQRFLYRPLTRALKAREEEVSRRLEDAERARLQAEAEAKSHSQAILEFEQQRENRLKDTAAEAEALRARLLSEAHVEQETLREKWRSQLEDEKGAFVEKLRRKAGESFANMARSILLEMADTELVERMASVFSRRLAGLEPEAKSQLKAAAKQAGRVQIASSFPLGEKSRTQLSQQIAEIAGADASVGFRHDPSLECGLVLQAGSRRAAWTLGEYLDLFEDDIARLFAGDSAKRRDA